MKSSERKSAATRRNSLKSTGPRSAIGKGNSRRNAFKHGLAVPIVNDPAFSAEIDETASTLMFGCGGQELRAARTVAEAQLEFLRVNTCRATRVAARLAGIPVQTPAVSNERCDASDQGGVGEFGADETALMYSAALVQGMLELLPELKKLDRYEQRAFSRRSRAIVALTRIQRGV